MRATRFLAVVLTALIGASLLAQDATETAARRGACRKLLGDGESLLLRGRTEAQSRQGDDFYYLTGIEDPGYALLVAAKGDLLFAPAAADGGQPAAPKGFAKVRPASELDDAVAKAAAKGKVLDDRRGRSLLGKLRRIKSPAEIETLRQACSITCQGQVAVMRAAAPGMYERELQSILETVFTNQGAPHTGFPSILGSGPNSCILHWSENTRRTEAGDVVVVDIGAEYQHYTGDVTRTIPISGKFTARQRQVYEVVLAANEAAIAMIAPGVDMRAVDKRVEQVMTDGLTKLGILKQGERPGLRRYYTHGLSHPIGLTVHDVGGLGKLEPGMVITIEPGLYFPDEKMGFRIEDDVLVTSKGHEVLTSAAPKQVAAIEQLMAQPATAPRGK